jgi:ribonuclease T2
MIPIVPAIRSALAGILLAALAPLNSLTAGALAAGDRAGDFDFYVLALSWSPTYCDSRGARASRLQCGTNVERAFVVHGLWPQYQRGYPENCATNEALRLPRSLIDTVLDIMPSPGLVGRQWRKHGTCTGLTPAEYLETVRRAYDMVNIPQAFRSARRRQTVSARGAEQAFLAENPGLSESGIAIACRDSFLSEVRICLTRGLEFRRCENVDASGCRQSRLVMPADR